MTIQEYIKIAKDLIKGGDIDIVYEIAATNTANIDTVAEYMVDTIAFMHPTDNDTDRDNLVKTVYKVLREDYAEEVKRGEKIQAIMIVAQTTNINIWDLYDLLENATPEQLTDYERQYNIK